jgi:hypothetical protein
VIDDAVGPAPQLVDALLAAGASPTLGMPTARQAAQYFGREEMLQVLIAHTNTGGQP